MEIIFIKVFLVLILSLLLGLERQFSNKPVGFGTFIFVSLGSCALGLISLSLSAEEPLIIAGGVVTGIGFLGAGALIKNTDRIFGFTTAASIWIFAIIGLCVGLGEYFIGLTTYGAVWTVIIVDKALEKKGLGSHMRKLTITTSKIVDKDKILSIFGEHKWKLMHLETHKKDKMEKVVYLISTPRSYVNELNNLLNKTPWVKSFVIE